MTSRLAPLLLLAAVSMAARTATDAAPATKPASSAGAAARPTPAAAEPADATGGSLFPAWEPNDHALPPAPQAPDPATAEKTTNAVAALGEWEPNDHATPPAVVTFTAQKSPATPLAATSTTSDPIWLPNDAVIPPPPSQNTPGSTLPTESPAHGKPTPAPAVEPTGWEPNDATVTFTPAASPRTATPQSDEPPHRAETPSTEAASHDSPTPPASEHHGEAPAASVHFPSPTGHDSPTSPPPGKSSPAPSSHGEKPAVSAPPGAGLLAKPGKLSIPTSANATEAIDKNRSEFGYTAVLNSAKSTPAQKREAALGLARFYRQKGDHTRAVATYESLLKQFPEGGDFPEIYLELGRSLRTLGAHKLAITRFYSVLNTSLKLPTEGAERYRQLARTAQYEIAETYFQRGDYQEANKFFSRLSLLDLAPEDRAAAQFKSAYSLVLAGDYEKAIQALRAFVESSEDNENTPEARYNLAITLRRVGRPREAFTQAIDLLKSEQALVSKDPERWAYWQRRTGNQLANEFYQQGDFATAQAIYKVLSEIVTEPTWRFPTLYQQALCQERLGQFGPATATYKEVIEGIAKAVKPGGKNDLDDVAAAAKWRLQQLGWTEKNTLALSSLPPLAPSTTVTAPAPAAVPTP